MIVIWFDVVYCKIAYSLNMYAAMHDQLQGHEMIHTAKSD